LNKNIPLARPWLTGKEIEAVEEVLESRWWIQGPKVEEFEKRFAEYIGTKYAVAVNSCTAALHVSLAALSVGARDEVIAPTFSFIASANAILHQNARPVLADIDPKTYNINVDDLKKRITKKTKAIIPVHQFGQPADMDQIMDLAERHNIPVIEDAACAHGAKYHGKNVGGIGRAGCFSFHPRKVICTGEGGIITTNDDELAERACMIRSHGMTSETWIRTVSKSVKLPRFSVLGYNYRMSDIAAAIGLIQLKHINEAVEKRIKVAERYNRGLEGISGIDVPFIIDGVKHVYQSYVPKVKPNCKLQRDELILKLKEKGVASQAGNQAIHLEPLYQSLFGYKLGDLPHGEEANQTTISLPMYAEITDEEVDYVLNCLSKLVT